MADISKAYGNIFEENNSFRKISYFFTQRKITESQDSVNPTTLARTKKEVNFITNYLALVLPKDEKSPKLRIEIYGNKGYVFQGEINSFTENIPHLLIPLNNDKEIFVNIFELVKNDKNDLSSYKNIKYLTFIHIPKRYQSIIEDYNDMESNIDNQSKNNITKDTKDIKVNL